MTSRYFCGEVDVELIDDTICFRLTGEEGEASAELYFPARCAWSMAAALMTVAAGSEDKARRIARKMGDDGVCFK